MDFRFYIFLNALIDTNEINTNLRLHYDIILVFYNGVFAERLLFMNTSILLKIIKSYCNCNVIEFQRQVVLYS